MVEVGVKVLAKVVVTAVVIVEVLTVVIVAVVIADDVVVREAEAIITIVEGTLDLFLMLN